MGPPPQADAHDMHAHVSRRGHATRTHVRCCSYHVHSFARNTLTACAHGHSVWLRTVVRHLCGSVCTSALGLPQRHCMYGCAGLAHVRALCIATACRAEAAIPRCKEARKARLREENARCDYLAYPPAHDPLPTQRPRIGCAGSASRLRISDLSCASCCPMPPTRVTSRRSGLACILARQPCARHQRPPPAHCQRRLTVAYR
jgi:hypothetical protein